MRYRYFGTKELRSVSIFPQQGGISRVDCLRVCPVLAMQAYVDRTSSRVYIHSDPVWPYEHVFMSQVLNSATRLHFPVGSRTCSGWLCTMMERVGIDLKYKGGSVGKAAASGAIDRDVPIDVVLNTGRSSTSSTTELVFVRWLQASA